jgi:hypothetical protein
MGFIVEKKRAQIISKIEQFGNIVLSSCSYNKKTTMKHFR